MILKARVVVTMDGPPIEDGAVLVESNQIRAVGRARDLAGEADAGETLDLGEMVLMPGLLNAHCHLDYSMLRQAISPPKSFTAWVQRINALKRNFDDADYLAAIAAGFAELRRWGTTSVANIESFPELMPRLPRSPIRTWWFYEMIDIRHRFTSEQVVAGALSFFEQRGDSLDRFGLSPHAPYTASVALYALANECAGPSGMALTTHVAESAEESAMFRSASGALHDFMQGLKRPMADCGRKSPFAHLWESGAINTRWILAHMNELDEADFALLASRPGGGPGPHIVHCPGSHRYFSHAPFPFRRLHELGLNLCVGTDSLASTLSLSLLGELRLLRDSQPWLTAEELLRCVTVNPALALGQQGRLGLLRAGALADLIALPLSGDPLHVYQEIVSYSLPIPWMMVDGHVLS